MADKIYRIKVEGKYLRYGGRGKNAGKIRNLSKEEAKDIARYINSRKSGKAKIILVPKKTSKKLKAPKYYR